MAQVDAHFTYNSNDSIILQQVSQALEELESEEVNRLCTTSEHIVNNVVIGLGLLHQVSCIRDSIGNGSRFVLAKIKIFLSELINHWINLNHGSVNAVRNKGRRGSSNAKATVLC